MGRHPSLQPGASGAGVVPVEATRQSWLAARPGVQYQTWGDSTRIYGRGFATGNSAAAAAEQFRLTGAKSVYGVEPADLQPYAPFLPDRAVNQVPVMPDRQNGGFKFTNVYYTQVRDGLEVFRSRLILLSRNVASHDIVLASSELHNLGAFHAPAGAAGNVNTGPAFAAVAGEVDKDAVFSNARNVIFAGTNGKEVAPTVGVEFMVTWFNPATQMPEEWLYVCDAQTGAILFKENQICQVDVTGNVSGMCTTGNAAAECNAEAIMPLPYATVGIGATTVFTDINGNFTIPNAGAGSVTVDASLNGQYFDIFNQSAGATTLSQSVTPPGPADFVFNQANTDEFLRANANVYREANVVRDHCLAQNPAYPTISTQTDFPCNVNINLNCNAFYSPSAQTINFYIAGGGCSNTGNATVVHHEYGHHMVQMAGSGQDAYGEGMSDCQSLLIADSSCLGDGFQTCGVCLREADNTIQYPYVGGHEGGRLISGCVWSTRNELLATNPGDYMVILKELIVNSILVHTGTSITPSITIDVLTLDDDDANLGNGTPHYNQINAGFGAHNMPGPAISMQVTPATGLVSSGLMGGPFSPDSANFTVTNIDSVPISYDATSSAAWLTLTNASGVIPVGNSAIVTATINANANSLGNGIYSDTVQIVNQTTGYGNANRPVNLEIGRLVYVSTDTPKPLPDTSTVTSTRTIADGYCVGDVDVEINLSHTYIGDLQLDLQSPNGTVVTLHNNTGGSANDIMKTYSDGTVNPDGPGVLADFIGESVGGNWTLTIVDSAGGDSGTLNNWALRIVPGSAVCPPVAQDVAVSVPVTVQSNITLVANSGTPGSLVYKIMSLPANGTLSDPNGGQIAAVPYTLLSQGDVVKYKPTLGYQGTDAFTYMANDGQDSNVADVDIVVGGPQVVHDFNLNTDPGWTTMGQWAWGDPTGGGTHNLDPQNGFTGTNVYGYNLAGDYPNNLAPVQYLTTTAIDLTGVTGTSLKFQRWLAIESSSFDHATVEVSNDGASWTTLFNHTGGSVSPTTWTQVTYDISAVADNQPTVYIRWGMGTTDSSVTYPGWNIDDVQILGLVPLCVADLDGNGAVDIGDYTEVILNWGGTGPAGDTDGDGAVNIADYTNVVLNWGPC